ncbi:MAG: hypothetical protein AAB554_01570 [Patescibacteria group bacterium]
MPVILACIMAATAVLLAVAVCAVIWRKDEGSSSGDASADRPAESPKAAAIAAAAPAREANPPQDAPPEGSLLTAQLEVGQTFHLQTRTAKYALTLRDPCIGLYDAVRVGPRDGCMATLERFQMLFSGTFIPNHGLRYGEFVVGGNLCYRKIRGDDLLDVGNSTPVTRILFSISEGCQQAS